MAGVPSPLLSDPLLAAIWERAGAGERLTAEDGIAMMGTGDLAGLGAMADRVNRARNGDEVLFVINRQVNPTNVCVLDCRFCRFAVRRGDPRAYEMTIEECVARLADDLTEVHIVGGLHPDWPWEHYLDLMRAIRRARPRIGIKAWTAVEIDYFARKFRMTPRRVLEELKEAGLDMLPGGGAEIFSERVRRELFPRKIGFAEWRDVHVLAHSLGIPSNATMLYGHIETAAERVEHIIRIREIQDETGGFLSFVPLAFQAGDTGIAAPAPSAVEDLKVIAASRLLLDNVPHVKAYWVMLGEETASVALAFGASDMDGTVGEERVAHAARAASPAGLTRARIVTLIREAGKNPVERDALYRVVAAKERGRPGVRERTC